MLSRALARARALTLEPACVMTNRPFWRKWWPENTQQSRGFFLTSKNKNKHTVIFNFVFNVKQKPILVVKMNGWKFWDIWNLEGNLFILKTSKNLNILYFWVRSTYWDWRGRGLIGGKFYDRLMFRGRVRALRYLFHFSFHLIYEQQYCIWQYLNFSRIWSFNIWYYFCTNRTKFVKALTWLQRAYPMRYHVIM